MTDALTRDPGSHPSPILSLYNDETDNASIVSDSATTISTVISCSKDSAMSPKTTHQIDWDKLLAVEERMISDDQEISLFVERLNLVKDEDWEECHNPVLSIQELKDIVANSSSLPFNDIPNVPSMDYDDSELSLWSGLLAEYRDVVLRVPKYASIMVRSGIPPALRGLAWKAMSEAGSPTLESLYDSLAAEWTPFVKIIGRDLNRTFPEIKMFREKGGEGQMKLGRVLRAYSAYDMQVGYCQGLTFLTGPLLLHMDDRDAFCVLVKLMEDYELRSMFTADMAGVQLRTYQFENLLAAQFPDLFEHFAALEVNSIYASQWFLSFFAVTCPLGMLVRIFDLTFAEGAVPTLMRVALAVIKRNKHILMAFDDEEQILQHLLGRCLWDSYGLDADLLLTDVSEITLCTNEKLRELEQEFKLGGKPIRVKKPSAGPLASFPFFRWSSFASAATAPVTPPAKTDTEPAWQSASRMSITSYDSEGSSITQSTGRNNSYPSSTSSFTSYETSSATSKASLVETATLKDKVASLTAEVEKLKFELQNRDRLSKATQGNDKKEDDSVTENQCCEKLRMELALVKTNEVLARQEIEQLKHALHTAAAAQQAAPVPAPAPEPVKGWLW